MKHVTIPDEWSGREALAVVSFLENVIAAVWRAHGPQMAPLLGRPRPPRKPPHRAPRPRDLRRLLPADDEHLF